MAGALALARAARGRVSVSYWSAGFAGVAVAALLGGAWHLWSPRLPGATADLLWKATLVAAGLGGFLFIAGVAYGSTSRAAARWIVSGASIKLLVFLARMFRSESFDPVIFDSVFTLATILLLQIVAFAKDRAESAPWVIAGVLVSFAAAALEALRPSLPPIGPDAAYHLTQLLGLYFFYRGGLLFR